MKPKTSRITKGFKPLPVLEEATRENARMTALINKRFEEVHDVLCELIRIRTAPDEAKQRVGVMKNDLRSAAQNAISAIGFCEMAKSDTPTEGDN